MNEGQLIEANAARTRTAAERVCEAAQRVLSSDQALPSSVYHVLSARVMYPNDSLAELGQRLGLTKDAYAARLRRAIRTEKLR